MKTLVKKNKVKTNKNEVKKNLVAFLFKDKVKHEVTIKTKKPKVTKKTVEALKVACNANGLKGTGSSRTKKFIVKLENGEVKNGVPVEGINGCTTREGLRAVISKYGFKTVEKAGKNVPTDSGKINKNLFSHLIFKK
jgi:hypothetical protein